MDPTSQIPLTQLLPNEEAPPYSAPIFRPTRRRTASFSSSSSSSSRNSSFRSSSFSSSEEFPLFSPIISPLNFKGVPFSWEQIPGIPKHQGLKNHSSTHLLPPPPAAAKKVTHKEETSPKKSNRFQRDDDPFFAAFVECSKDCTSDDEYVSTYGNITKSKSKITRTLSGRFGSMNMHTSCKRTCAVSESIVPLPRISSHYPLNRRSS